MATNYDDFQTDIQFTEGSSPHLIKEIGTAVFSTNETSITLYTRLTKIVCAIVSANGTVADGTEQYSCPRTVTNGTVTINRTTQADTGGSAAVTSGMEVSYILIGT
jgi:hypothetical protein